MPTVVLNVALSLTSVFNEYVRLGSDLGLELVLVLWIGLGFTVRVNI